jgi:hypothetical protein
MLVLLVVTNNKLKMLNKLEPKGEVAGRGSDSASLVDSNATGKQSGPNPQEVAHVEHGKPVLFREFGRQPQGVSMRERVKERGKSEGLPVTGRIGIAEHPTSSHAKAGRLPQGLSEQET